MRISFSFQNKSMHNKGKYKKKKIFVTLFTVFDQISLDIFSELFSKILFG